MSASALITAARDLDQAVRKMHFAPPVAHVYNPLDYAWAAHEQYLRRFGEGRKQVVFVGMNPGPFGMMQTGVPFGEIAAVRDWMHVQAQIEPPAHQHPKRPIEGFACPRSEVSGRRLWGWAAQRFGSADEFFEHAFVLNYCPLVFLEASGRNYVPEKLPASELRPLQEACDAHLRAAIEALSPAWAIGVGGYAMKRIQAALGPNSPVRIDQILHPSPASPAANRGWAEAVERKLGEIGCFAGAPPTR